MKKKLNLFLLVTAVIFNYNSFGQIFNSLNKFVPTRENVSNYRPNRQDESINVSEMRVVLFEENFQTEEQLPNNLPLVWSTNEVTQFDGSLGNSFKLHNSSSANVGNYWPVAELGVGNVFAGANDDGTPCDCLMDEVYLETPPLDFSSVQYPAVTFDIYHDGNFGGGDAWLQVSTDGGSSWSIVNYNGSEVFPKIEGYWQTLVITLFEFSGVPDLRMRFTWSDAGSWASGFAVDNVVVGDLESYSLTLDRTILGDWNSQVFGNGYWDYTKIPILQSDSVKVTGVLSNTGLNPILGAQMGIDIYQNDVLVYSDITSSSDEISSLSKDTVSLISEYIPNEVGVYTINSTAILNETETDTTDNNSSVSFEISECTYARDMGMAQAFFQLESGDFAGNLFDIYQNEEYYGIQVAVGAGSTVGSSIVGVIYKLTGFDTNTGEPILEFVEGSETDEGEIIETDLNGALGNNFICLPFSSPVILEAGNVYLAGVVSYDVLRLPVSGSNSLPASWIYQDSQGSYGWTQGVFMVRMVGQCVDCQLPSSVKYENDEKFVVSNSPNPAKNSTVIKYSINDNNLVLTVRDINGVLVETINLNNSYSGKNTYELNLSNYSSGMYFYTIHNKNYEVSSKFIVE